MPRYDYKCPKCGYFEARRGVEESFTPCPTCGESAKREPCSGLPAIRGETVGRSFGSSRSVDQKGRYRLSDFQEASEEVIDAHDRADKREGVELPRPDLYKEGLKKAASLGATIRRK